MRQLSDIILNQSPLIMDQQTSIQQACEKMASTRVGAVLVTDKETLLTGIFTGRDAVKRVIADGRDPATTALTDAMTHKPVTMSPEKSAIEALRLMWDGGFRHIPVVDAGRILGMVSKGDFNASEEDCLEAERNLWEHMR